MQQRALHPHSLAWVRRRALSHPHYFRQPHHVEPNLVLVSVEGIEVGKEVQVPLHFLFLIVTQKIKTYIIFINYIKESIFKQIHLNMFGTRSSSYEQEEIFEHHRQRIDARMWQLSNGDFTIKETTTVTYT